MGKDFYGIGDEVHEEVSFQNASLKQKSSFLIIMVEALLTVMCFVVGGILESDRLLFIGGILACLLPTFIIIGGRTLLSKANKQKFVTKLCSILLPGIGYYILALLLISLAVVDKERYILLATSISIVLVLVGVGCGMCIGYRVGKKKAKKYTEKVSATCVCIDEKKMLMNLIDDITKTNYEADINKASVFIPSFQYEYDGKEYTSELSYGYGNVNNIFEEGKKVEIFVDPKNPSDFSCVQDGERVFLYMGIAFVVCGLGSAVLLFFLL